MTCRSRLGQIVSVALVLFIASCAVPPKKKEEVVFYPPAPELPRLQYLTSFNSSKEVEEEQSAFDLFVEGRKVPQYMSKPYGVGINNGKLYVCDTNIGLMVFDLKAKSFGFLKGARGRGKLIQPVNISIETDGVKYVTDPVRGQVVAFDRNDEYLTVYGLKEPWKPVSAAAFGDMLYVVDLKNQAVRVFYKKSGELVKTFGNKGEPKERLSRPENIAFDRDGYLYIADAGRFEIVKFDRDGHFKSAIGGPGDNLGQFARPRGITLDREDNLYVVDAAFNNVQVFNSEGRLLLSFGEAGDSPGQFILPAQVVVDYDNVEYFRKYIQPGFAAENLVIVTSQLGDHMVSVFASGKEIGQKYPTDEEIMQSLKELKQKALQKLKEKEPLEKNETEKKGATGGPAKIPETK